MRRLYLLLAGIVLAHAGPPAMPPTPVDTTHIDHVWQAAPVTVIGQVHAIHGVTLTTEYTGQVLRLYAHAGQTLHADDPIVQLKPHQLLPAWVGAKHQLALAHLQASNSKALYKKQAASRFQMQRDLLTEAIAHDTLKQAASQLAKTLLRAPFDGELGLTHVNIGQHVVQGQTPIATLTQWTPIWVDFSLAQSEAHGIHHGMPLTVQTNHGQTIKGKILAHDPVMNAQTHRLAYRAIFDNPTHQLIPGDYVKIHIQSDAHKKTVRVPLIAINASPMGYSVYVVKNGKVHKQPVVLGAQGQYFVEVVKGLHLHDVVVTSGRHKIYPGAAIKPNPPKPYAY